MDGGWGLFETINMFSCLIIADAVAFLAPEHQPIQTIYNTIKEIADGITNSNFKVKDFRKSHLVRLNTLNYLREQKLINGNLEWIN